MAYQISYNCAGTCFDYHDSERVARPKDGHHSYFITPKRLAQIQNWMIDNFIMEIKEEEQIKFIIDNNWMSKYGSC